MGRCWGGTANDGDFQNDSMLLQGVVLMVAPVLMSVTRCNLQERRGIEMAASYKQGYNWCWIFQSCNRLL